MVAALILQVEVEEVQAQSVPILVQLAEVLEEQVLLLL
jgi:hypothetical protein